MILAILIILKLHPYLEDSYPALNFQSFLAGLAASGVLTSALRLITKAAFENSQNGLRNGASKYLQRFFQSHILIFSAFSNVFHIL